MGNMHPSTSDQLAASYAALILHDSDNAITAENINTLLKAAGIKGNSPWPNLYAQVFAKRKISDFLIAGVSSGAPAAAPAAGGAAPAAAASAPAKEEKKVVEEKKEESDEDMGFGLFD